MQQPTLWTRLAWAEPLWIALLAPSLLFPGRFWETAFHPVLVLLLLLFWPIRRLAYGHYSLRTPLDWSVGLLLLWVPVALWASVDRGRSWEEAGYLTLGVALYFALINWPPSRHRPQIVAWLLVLLGTMLSVLGPLVVASSLPATFAKLELARLLVRNIAGETLNRNVWAGALLLVIPLYGSLAITPHWSRQRWQRPVLALLGIFAVGLILITDSRGAYIALVLSLTTLVVLRWPRSIILVAPLLLVSGAALGWIGIRPAMDYLLADAGLSGWSGRPEIWFRAVSAIQDFPWTGVGLGLYVQVIPALYPYFVLADGVEHAHNLYLQIGVDMGLPGLVAYLAVIVGAFAMLARPLRRRGRHDPMKNRQDSGTLRQQSLYWALAAGTSAALVALLVHGLVDAVTWGTKLAFLPWMLFALAASLRLSQLRRRRKQRRGSGQQESDRTPNSAPT